MADPTTPPPSPPPDGPPAPAPVPPAGPPVEPAPASAPEEAAAPADAVEAPDDEATAPAPVDPPKPKAKAPVKARVSFPPSPSIQVLAVRSGPGTNYPIVARLPEGTTVMVTKVQGSWGELSRGGWSSLSYLVKV